MNTQIIIRPASLEDLPMLYEFEQGIIDAERPMDITLKSGEIHYYDLEAMIQAEDVEVVVAENNGLLIGSAYVAIRESKSYWTHDRHGYLGFMFVRPEYRGQGVNGLLMDECIKWSKAQGLEEIQLDVYPENVAALKAYHKAGMTNHLLKMRKSI